MAIGVDAGRDERVDRHDAATLADLQDRASAATNVNGPASASERVRNSSTWASSSLAISETWDFDKLVMPSD